MNSLPDELWSMLIPTHLELFWGQLAQMIAPGGNLEDLGERMMGGGFYCENNVKEKCVSMGMNY